ncbi:MAG: transglutaminase family protein, partial [Actinomycetia bacterium]|nr:transglutaminase family protein [Actinomycetes bacterium]
MRLDIRYRMFFAYDAPVREEHNEVRVRPRDDSRQRLLAYRLTPVPAVRVLSFIDYWGSTVEHVGLVPDHDHFEIIAEAAVETRMVDPIGTTPLALVTDNQFRHDNVEFLGVSNHVVWDESVATLARDAIAGTDDVVGAVDAIMAEVRRLIAYEKGSTTIGIRLDELLEGGAGVCQDFTHLTIGMLRAVGIPARYISGYLFAADETEIDPDHSEPVTVQTHAWVEAAVPGQGWLAVDPTNDRRVGERHVVIGHGRDYDDVAPVRGIYLGEASPTVDATVEIRRMEPIDRASTERPRRRSGPWPVL